MCQRGQYQAASLTPFFISPSRAIIEERLETPAHVSTFEQDWGIGAEERNSDNRMLQPVEVLRSHVMIDNLRSQPNLVSQVSNVGTPWLQHLNCSSQHCQEHGRVSVRLAGTGELVLGTLQRQPKGKAMIVNLSQRHDGPHGARSSALTVNRCMAFHHPVSSFQCRKKVRKNLTDGKTALRSIHFSIHQEGRNPQETTCRHFDIFTS